MGARAHEYFSLSTESRSLPRWVMPLAGVTLTDSGLAALLHPRSWPSLALSVAILTLATAFVAWAVAARTSRFSVGDVAPIVMASLWIAPLAVLVSERSIWAIPPALLAAIAWTHVAGTAAKVSHAMLPVFCASVFLQIGTAAVFADRPMAAAPLLSVSAAIITWRKDTHPKPWTITRSSRTIALATAFTALGLFHYLPHGSGSGGSSLAGANAAQEVGRIPFGGTTTTNVDVYRGVILWPKEQAHITLIPPLPAMSSRLFRPDQANPLSIPFYGVYWFFEPPVPRPPDDAVVMRGDPSERVFRSNDNAPLAMEAHQNLGKLIDVTCCSRIEVEVRNADHYTGMIAVELILFNTVLPAKPHQSLGAVALRSRPLSSSLTEILRFPIPASPAIRQFDEFTIRFPREQTHSYRSAKIGIERFVLVPR
jgi:hypothetical protein